MCLVCTRHNQFEEYYWDGQEDWNKWGSIKLKFSRESSRVGLTLVNINWYGVRVIHIKQNSLHSTVEVCKRVTKGQLISEANFKGFIQGVAAKASAVGFCLGCGLFGSYNSL